VIEDLLDYVWISDVGNNPHGAGPMSERSSALMTCQRVLATPCGLVC